MFGRPIFFSSNSLGFRQLPGEDQLDFKELISTGTFRQRVPQHARALDASDDGELVTFSDGDGDADDDDEDDLDDDDEEEEDDDDDLDDEDDLDGLNEVVVGVRNERECRLRLRPDVLD